MFFLLGGDFHWGGGGADKKILWWGIPNNWNSCKNYWKLWMNTRAD